MTPLEQLLALREELKPLLDQHLKCWQDDVLPKLKKNGVHIHRMDELTMDERGQLREHFEKVIFPTLTAAGPRPGAPVPVHFQPIHQSRGRGPGQPRAREVRPGEGAERIVPRLVEFDDDTDKSGKGVHFVSWRTWWHPTWTCCSRA